MCVFSSLVSLNFTDFMRLICNYWSDLSHSSSFNHWNCWHRLTVLNRLVVRIAVYLNFSYMAGEKLTLAIFKPDVQRIAIFRKVSLLPSS